MTCEWCGEAHAREALCQARPKWSRRGFLALVATGAAGLVLADKLPALGEDAFEATYQVFFEGGWRAGKTMSMADEMLTRYIAEGLNQPNPLKRLFESGEWVETAGRILTRRKQ